MTKKIVQTAGRDALGTFAPLFAEANDDILFGKIWNDPSVDVKTRCLLTVTALTASGITDSSLQYHLQNAKNHGVSRDEIAGVLTHVGFYAGWPKAWAAFNLAKKVWADDTEPVTEKDRFQKEIMFPIGAPNDAFARYFIGQSYLAPVSKEQIAIYNVTFEPGCRNNWHVHHADKGGGQLLICIGGEGIYQAWGEKPVLMTQGTVVNIPAGVKHWHGALQDSWFAHLAMDPPGVNTSNEWLEAVSDADYATSCQKAVKD
jgi:4-carboxymuconolactone decarboxylase